MAAAKPAPAATPPSLLSLSKSIYVDVALRRDLSSGIEGFALGVSLNQRDWSSGIKGFELVFQGF